MAGIRPCERRTGAVNRKSRHMFHYEIKVGGDVTNASIAMGEGARSGAAITGESARRHAMALVDAFIEEMKNCDAQAPGVIEVQLDAAAIKREVNSAKPDKSEIRALLSRIEKWGNGAGAAIIRASALAVALENIRSAISHL